MKGWHLWLHYFATTVALWCVCNAVHHLNKRYLIFPRQAPTRHQFIGGIGIPADLEYESLTIGHVLKAMFYLPYNATVYRQNPYLPEYNLSDTINGRHQQQQQHHVTKRSPLRWEIYAYIIERLNSYGHNGQECLLRCICEANALPFERNFNVFSELMHILVSPSTSKDADFSASRNFLDAEKLGRIGNSEACAIFDCKMSLLKMVSSVLKIDF